MQSTYDYYRDTVASRLQLSTSLLDSVVQIDTGKLIIRGKDTKHFVVLEKKTKFDLRYVSIIT